MLVHNAMQRFGRIGALRDVVYKLGSFAAAFVFIAKELCNVNKIQKRFLALHFPKFFPYMEAYFCIFPYKAPVAITAEDAQANSSWRQGFASIRMTETLTIAKLRVQEVKSPVVLGGIVHTYNRMYEIDIDDHPNYAWCGGHFETRALPFVFCVYQLGNKIVGKVDHEARRFVAGILAAGGDPKLCYRLEVVETNNVIRVNLREEHC